MQLFAAALAITAAIKWQPAESLEPLLESNEPPYTLINFALEEDPRVDQRYSEKQRLVRLTCLNKHVQNSRRTRLDTQFSRRREWLDTQFEHLRRKQRQNKEGKWNQVSHTQRIMHWARCLLAAIRPSGLAVRLPRTGIADDTRNVNKALKSIRKELGVSQMRETKPKPPKPSDDGDSASIGNKLDVARLNLKNKLHRSIWLAMKRRDKPQFTQLEKQIRATDVELDGVSYTLLVHATLLFHGPGDEAMALIQEMRERGVHPSLIRFNARIVAAHAEMDGLGARPLPANIVQMARASWLTAVFITRRYPTQESILRMEAEIEEREQRYLESDLAVEEARQRELVNSPNGKLTKGSPIE
ncbi:hypothetical protein BBBOND_0111200 [Babesia bigemina]|uniref:Uncharacterized protein n=1 Tax=Babesia bigemina TaxID=5866 RepID=A0A061D457_BABBI|nr:hypothetical protein BBBOND_0111200 [Babesia bigemina]CDR94822.1 hypothetical protein BBBOND_0111200 [Babesia bigemina]|eukprot:XP_012767008.1 hypothetical protein BBBOND_0111200 [Babesia bigemina]